MIDYLNPQGWQPIVISNGKLFLELIADLGPTVPHFSGQVEVLPQATRPQVANQPDSGQAAQQDYPAFIWFDQLD